MGQTVEQRCSQLGVAEDRRPFGKAEVGGDCHAGALVQLREQMKQQRTTGLTERQIAQPLGAL